MLDIGAVLESIIDSAVEGTVIVDANGIVVFLNRAYEYLLGIKKEEAIGKLVTEVIENTRLHIVVKTGIPEIGEIQKIKGKNALVQRIPILKNGRVVAGVGKVIFKNVEEMQDIISKLKNKVEYYENQLKNLMEAKYSFGDIITCSHKMIELKKMAERVACTNVTILIRGESGVGKELFAHAIHKTSPRSSGPFVRVNCAAIPENLFEAELFGYEGGAFTDAKKSGKFGKLELANGGTIFLDEIGDMPLAMQAKTLRFLQEKEIERVGGLKPIKIDVRIIAATNQKLEEMINRGKYREDLYFRLNVISLSVPPLRERKEDIPLLAEHLIDKFCSENKLPPKIMQPDTLTVLQSYNWPGNVRELYNTVEKMVNLAEDFVLTPNDIPKNISGKRSHQKNHLNKPLKKITEDTEREVLVSALYRTKGNKKQAAMLLGMNRSTLYDKLKKYGLDQKSSMHLLGQYDSDY